MTSNSPIRFAALVPTVAAVLIFAAACSSDDDRASDAAGTGPTVTAVAGQPEGTEQQPQQASEFCSNLGTGGIEDILGGPPTEVVATDTSCSWSEERDGATRELAITLTPYPTDEEAREAVSADDEPDPHLEGFAASAVEFSDDDDVGKGEVRVASGPAVLTFTATGSGLTRSQLAAGAAAVIQG